MAPWLTAGLLIRNNGTIPHELVPFFDQAPPDFQALEVELAQAAPRGWVAGEEDAYDFGEEQAQLAAECKAELAARAEEAAQALGLKPGTLGTPVDGLWQKPAGLATRKSRLLSFIIRVNDCFGERNRAIGVDRFVAVTCRSQASKMAWEIKVAQCVGKNVMATQLADLVESGHLADAWAKYLYGPNAVVGCSWVGGWVKCWVAGG